MRVRRRSDLLILCVQDRFCTTDVVRASRASHPTLMFIAGVKRRTSRHRCFKAPFLCSKCCKVSNMVPCRDGSCTKCQTKGDALKTAACLILLMHVVYKACSCLGRICHAPASDKLLSCMPTCCNIKLIAGISLLCFLTAKLGSILHPSQV